MKLTTFNETSVPTGRQTSPSIGCNVKSGTIRFNRPAVERMKLKENQLVQFHHDEDDEGMWYLEVVKQDGFLLRQKDVAGKGGMVIQSCALVRKIFESINFTGESGNLRVGAEAIKTDDKKTLWPIITASLTNY